MEKPLHSQTPGRHSALDVGAVKGAGAWLAGEAARQLVATSLNIASGRLAG